MQLTVRFFITTYLGSLFCSIVLCLNIFSSLTHTSTHIILIISTTLFFVLFYAWKYKNLPNGCILFGTLYMTWMSTLLLFRTSDFSISGWNFVPFVHTIELLQNLSFKNMVWYFGGNTLLFLPIGILFVYITNSVRHTLYMGLVLMIVVEVIQGLTGLGVCDIDDLLMNIFGIVMGSLLRIVTLEIGKNQKVRNL